MTEILPHCYLNQDYENTLAKEVKATVVAETRRARRARSETNTGLGFSLARERGVRGVEIPLEMATNGSGDILSGGLDSNSY